jgi:hypothetical protein
MKPLKVICLAFGLALALSPIGTAALAQGVPVIDLTHPQKDPDKVASPRSAEPSGTSEPDRRGEKATRRAHKQVP